MQLIDMKVIIYKSEVEHAMTAYINEKLKNSGLATSYVNTYLQCDAAGVMRIEANVLEVAIKPKKK